MTTPIHDLPLVPDTALVTDGAAAIRALAEAVDGLLVASLPSGEDAATPPTGFPSGVSLASVLASNGFPVTGMLLTVARGSYSTQTLIGASGTGAPRVLHRSAGTEDTDWTDWTEVASIDELTAAVASLTADIDDVAGEVDVLQATAHSVQGTYVGDGTSDRTIALGFTPKTVELSSTAGAWSLSGPGVGSALYGICYASTGDIVRQTSYIFRPEIVSGGFRVGQTSAQPLTTNDDGETYTYVAHR